MTDEARAVREARSLDDWYEKINLIYLEPNFRQDAFSMFTHLVEVIGGLSLIASERRQVSLPAELAPELYLPKALSWWLTLCGRVGVASVERLLWTKYPHVCPYCRACPHLLNCRSPKRGGAIDWIQLEAIGRDRATQQPRSIYDWQLMFRKIYGPGDEFSRDRAFARIAEELGELAEAIRVFGAEPSYFISEAADLFAWLMHLQNGLDRDGDPSLARQFAAYFPDACNVCQQSSCVCPPIQERTMGRIAHEVPTIAGSFRPGGNLLPPQVIREQFKRAQSLRLGNRAIRVDASDVETILTTLDELRGVLSKQPDHSPELTNLMTRMVEQERLTQEELIRLRELIERQPPPERSAIFRFLENAAANQVSGAIYEVARYLTQG